MKADTMRRTLPTWAFPLALLLACAAWQAPAQAAGETARVIVKFKAEAVTLRRQALAADERREARADALGTRRGLALRSGYALAERTQVMTAEGIGSQALAERLRREADVEYAVVDQRRRAFAAPNDPYYLQGPSNGVGAPAAGQWYLHAPDATLRSAIGIEAAWNVTPGDPAIVVAVLDTGVRFDHADLQPVGNGGNLLRGYDFVSNDFIANDGQPGRDDDASDPGDIVTSAAIADPSNTIGCGADEISARSSWHGTETAGLIGATTDNGIGIAGVGRTVRVLPVRVLGRCGGYDSDIIAAMRWAAGLAVPGVPANPNPARVINMSLGGGGSCTAAYSDAVAAVGATGTVVVASAGNSTGHAVSVPANCPGVIAVAGLRHAGTKVGFSDLGPEIAIAAPGGNCVNLDASAPCLYPIATTTNAGTSTPVAGSSIYSDSFNASCGTSFSAPLVAGTVALMLSARPALVPRDVNLLLQTTAHAFPTTGAEAPGETVPECTAPRFDAEGAPLEQLQCYCTTGTCGAGMLDAGAAVRAASTGTPAPGVDARIDLAAAAPEAGEALQFSAANSQAASGRQIVSYQWSLVDGGGIVETISDPTAVAASVVPSASGSFKLKLTVQDDLGAAASADLRVHVLEAPAGSPSETDPAEDSGGGALDFGWLLGLAAAVAALRRSAAH
jgi:serine protease